MRQGMSKKSSRELVESFRESYHLGNATEKTRMLSTIQESTGYERKYLIRLLQGKVPRLQESRRRTAHYGEEFRVALNLVWEACGYICAKRLIPFMSDFVPLLEKRGYLQVTLEVRQQLLSVSAATADRLLKIERRRIGRGISMTKPGNFLRQQIAVRTSSEWQDAVVPGFFEADLVAHNGGDVRGLYAYTLTMTDIWSGWTECMAIFGKGEDAVIAAVALARKRLPMPLLGFDSDNGSEFINQKMSKYCSENDITFTRCRPYKKNDQAHVEEKNGSVVRRFVGYARYDTRKSLNVLTELYRTCRLFVNFFQPSMKLIEKRRDGAKIKKKYASAKTPCQRLLESSLSEDTKRSLRDTLDRLDPVVLLSTIKRLQEQLDNAAKLEKNLELETKQPERLALSKKGIRMAPTNRPSKGKRGRPWLFSEPIKTLINSWLSADPTLMARQIVDMINARYPGSIERRQFPTVAEFVRQWRRAHPEHNAIYNPHYKRNWCK